MKQRKIAKSWYGKDFKVEATPNMFERKQDKGKFQILTAPQAYINDLPTHILSLLVCLSSVFIKELKPLFKNLTKNELLQRCLDGLTQNQNEAINGVLWSKCPKTKFCGKVKLLLGVSETVTQFNSGASSRASLISTVYAKPTGNMLALPKEDHT